MAPSPEEVKVGPATRVRLPGMGLETSRLGFGASALMSRVNRRDSVRLLETALDSGIAHVDVARSYGFGEAELAVGDVLAGRRDRVTVATKVGILPPRRSAGLSAAKAVARAVISAVPSMRVRVRQGAGALVQAGQFEPTAMADSLHTSLRQLRTDYVDLLLLHEPSVEVLQQSEALEFLERVQREGKTRAYGIAVTAEVAAYAVQHAREYVEVLQLPNSVFVPSMGRLAGAGTAVITHSALGSSVGELRGCLERSPPEAARWSRELQVDVCGPRVIERLALQYALSAVPDGVVLFTSTKVAHIRENAAVLETTASREQMEGFAELVAQWNAGRKT